MNFAEKEAITRMYPDVHKFIRPFPGASEVIQGTQRYCLWIPDGAVEEARSIPPIDQRLTSVAKMRSKSPKKPTLEAAATPHKYVELRQDGKEEIIVVPGISSENRGPGEVDPDHETAGAVF